MANFCSSKMAYSAQQRRNLFELLPINRLGTTEDVVNVIAFLVCLQGEWIYGQVMHVKVALPNTYKASNGNR